MADLPKFKRWRAELKSEGNSYGPYEYWEITDTLTDNHDVVATVPLTGDAEYDLEVTLQNAKLVLLAPEMAGVLKRVLHMLIQAEVNLMTKTSVSPATFHLELRESQQLLSDMLHLLSNPLDPEPGVSSATPDHDI